ncbi:hypothetical protein [Rhizobium sp. RAF56]|uniref:hypothetical protein n=1 Tax=Rhizobium sp. RAF56 TaxID=3233062 RepID=UPI003F94EEA8
MRYPSYADDLNRHYQSHARPYDDLAGVLEKILGEHAGDGSRTSEGYDKTPGERMSDLIDRMQAENVLIPYPLLEMHVASGTIPAAAVQALPWVQLAPGVLVAGWRLAWSPDIGRLVVLPCEDDNSRPSACSAAAAPFPFRVGVCHARLLEWAFNYFATPSGDGWQLVEQLVDDHNAGALGAAFKGDATVLEYQRVAPELDTVLRVVAGRRASDALPPVWRVIDHFDRWELWDTREVAYARFSNEPDAMRAADQAVIGEGGHAWMDLFASEDPTDFRGEK